MSCGCFAQRQNILKEKELQDYYEKILNKLSRIMKVDPLRTEDTVDNASLPEFGVKYIFKNVFMSYGVGYMLYDNSICFAFWDGSCLLMSHPSDFSLRYIDWNFEETLLTFNSSIINTKKLELKVSIMMAFAVITNDATDISSSAKTKLSDLPHVVKLVTYEDYVVLILSNQLMQIRFFNRSSIILCPITDTLTFIKNTGQATVYKLDLMERYGCSEELFFYITTFYEYVRHVLSGSSDELCLLNSLN